MPGEDELSGRQREKLPVRIFFYFALGSEETAPSFSMTHFFTPEEANKIILPRIRELLRSAVEAKSKLRFANAKDRMQCLDRLATLTAKISEMGPELKDLDMGLVDFPAVRFNEPVYLCWKLDENELLYWHEVSAGYKGRKLLKPEATVMP
jgi:hypothetical protein